MSRVVYRCRVCRELVPETQECAHCSPRMVGGKTSEWTPQRMVADDKLAAAYHLAKGSCGTAKDHGIRLESVDSVMSDEMQHLAANFLRISELLVEAGFRP